MKLRHGLIPLALLLTACSAPHQGRPQYHERAYDTNRHHEGPHQHAHKRQKHQAMMQRHFQILDLNDDGEITRDEYDRFHDEHFRRLDRDGDGRLQFEDFKMPD